MRNTQQLERLARKIKALESELDVLEQEASDLKGMLERGALLQESQRNSLELKRSFNILRSLKKSLDITRLQ